VLTSRRKRFGFSLIELMIVVVIAALLLMIGLPNMNIWLNNTKMRTAGETVLTGLQLARAEAVRRNATVRFQLVSDLTSACTLSMSGTSWVVSLADPPTPATPPPKLPPRRSSRRNRARKARPASC
jgi:type IV fimbrial biogenesis protein FimT